MIDHVWTVLCSRSIIDSESNNVTLQNVVEQLNISGEPTPEGMVPVELEVVTLSARADFALPGRGKGRVRLVPPSGDSVDVFEFDVDLSKHKRHRHRGHIRGLSVSGPGRYVFEVELRCQGDTEWSVVAVVPLEVVFVPPRNH